MAFGFYLFGVTGSQIFTDDLFRTEANEIDCYKKQKKN